MPARMHYKYIATDAHNHLSSPPTDDIFGHSTLQLCCQYQRYPHILLQSSKQSSNASGPGHIPVPVGADHEENNITFSHTGSSGANINAIEPLND